MQDSAMPAIMAILNITPDSFSDGGLLLQANSIQWDRLYERAATAINDGATMLDIGGESTRPGAAPVSLQQELDRVVPVLEALRARFDITLSVDTSRPEVMQAAVAVGANFINDVRALTLADALSVAANLNVPVCLMHMRGEPDVMQKHVFYDNVVDEVKQFLMARVDAFLAAGGKPENIVLDQGFGFGKTLAHNVALFEAIGEFSSLAYPLLVGVSRKSMFADITGRSTAERVAVSALAAALAAKAGAAIVRVHDVAVTVDAIKTMRVLGN